LLQGGQKSLGQEPVRDKAEAPINAPDALGIKNPFLIMVYLLFLMIVRYRGGPGGKSIGS
jgi:hypothetical protein